MGYMFCTTICGMLLFVASIHCNPIKRSASQRDFNCQGTDCFVDLHFPTAKIIDGHFQENLTQAIMTALSMIQGTQNKTVRALEAQDTYLRNITTTVNVALQRSEEQMQILTSTMAGVLHSVTTLLHKQLSILSERLPVILPARDCKDIAAQGGHVSGPYTITPQDGLESFTVYCDMDTDGGGWTVFQRRYDGSVDFYRGWDDYERGFGRPDGEYWAGLKQIHRLTRTGLWILRIDLEDFEGRTEYAQYDSFRVGDVRTRYQLFIGNYTGNGNDRLTYHNRQAFSTKDNDNDSHSIRHCAQYYKAGWWYDACHLSNLNGLYLGPSGDRYTGMVWHGRTSKRRSEMKIRRV